MVQPPPSFAEASTLTLALLAERAADATICPSEVARALVADKDPQTWRAAMPIVHAAVDQLLADDLVRLSWKGEPLAKRSGPYRIHRRRDSDRSPG